MEVEHVPFEKVCIPFVNTIGMHTFFSILLFTSLLACSPSVTPEKAASPQLVGGPCEGCEGVYEYGERILTSVDTLPEFGEYSPTLILEGTVYQKDGKTPAEGIIIYIYHTNRDGVYVNTTGQTGWGIRHGDLRGWVRTGKSGKYTFYTTRPASYPNRGSAAHVHYTVKEPTINEYYIDDVVFTDDPLFSEKERPTNPRCGSGVTTPIIEGNTHRVKRDIVLSVNIPNYPNN